MVSDMSPLEASWSAIFFFLWLISPEQKMTTIVMTSGQEIQIFYLFLREVINQIYVTLLLIVSTYVCLFPFC